MGFGNATTNFLAQGFLTGTLFLQPALLFLATWVIVEQYWELWEHEN